MPKRPAKSSNSSASPVGMILLALLALGVFVFGEMFLLMRSDSGRLVLARRLGIGDPAQITRLVGLQIHRGLDTAWIPRDSVQESVVENGRAPLRWRVGVPLDGSLFLTNYWIARTVQDRGARVLDGRESRGPKGETIVTLLIGLPRRPTHELTLVRGARPSAEESTEGAARLALVLYGFGDDPAFADSFFTLPQPFATALVPGGKSSQELFRRARHSSREVVLHLPLEPMNYPRVNPGPGTLTVTMRPARIEGLVREYLAQAGPVSAVANHMGSLATQDMVVMTAVYKVLKSAHQPFLHVSPAAGAVCRSLAAEMGVAYEEPDAVVDPSARGTTMKTLDKRWEELLKSARQQGHLLVMVRATPLTRAWLAHALTPRQLEGVSIVPVSALLRRPGA